jgi:hypothetical protein
VKRLVAFLVAALACFGVQSSVAGADAYGCSQIGGFNTGSFGSVPSGSFCFGVVGKGIDTKRMYVSVGSIARRNNAVAWYTLADLKGNVYYNRLDRFPGSGWWNGFYSTVDVPSSVKKSPGKACVALLNDAGQSVVGTTCHSIQK